MVFEVIDMDGNGRRTMIQLEMSAWITTHETIINQAHGSLRDFNE